MSEVQPRLPSKPNSEVGIGKIVLLVGLLSVAGVLFYNIFRTENVESSIPRAMQMTYIPSDFKMNLDEQKTLEILSNPQRYKQEFDELILNFNTNLVVHVSNRMGLNNQLRTAAVNEYRKMHPYVRQMYFNDFIGLTDTTSQIYQSWYENQGATAVDLLNEVASKYTCFFITSIMSTVLKTQDGKLAVQGSKIETPCGIALTEGLRPMVKRLQDAAAIRDFGKAKGMMKEKVEKAISELAVMEVRDKKGITVNNSTKVWGYDVSSTNVDITAISIIKVGYNLNQYLDISVDDNTRTVVVTLPQPQILSHEVYPKIENLDVGWMRELNSQDFNENINKLRQAFREEALNSDIFNKARQKAGGVMDMLLSPVVQNISKNYKITVRFKNAQEVLDYNLPKQDGVNKYKQPQPLTPAPKQQQQQPQQKQPQQRLDGQQSPPQYYKPSN
jgi:Protein of unknown function (DUF4230)